MYNIYRPWQCESTKHVYYDMFADQEVSALMGDDTSLHTVEALAERLKDEAFGYLSANNSNLIVNDWASKLLEQLDWREMAEHMLT